MHQPHRRHILGAFAAALAGGTWPATFAQTTAVKTKSATKFAQKLRIVIPANPGGGWDQTGRALGAGPLCTEGDHAQRCADLLTFIRQSHAETDLQWLGEAAARQEDCPWTL